MDRYVDLGYRISLGMAQGQPAPQHIFRDGYRRRPDGGTTDDSTTGETGEDRDGEAESP